MSEEPNRTDRTPHGVFKIRRSIHINLVYAQTISERIPQDVGRVVAHGKQN